MNISINEPCHENWEAMTPNQQGAFCKSCMKDVIDFSKMSLDQVKNFFSKPQLKVCGRFEEKQLQELSFDDFFSRFTYWNFSKKFVVIFFMAFGFWIFSNSSAFAQRGEHMLKGEVAVMPDKKIQKQTQTDPMHAEANKRMIKGKVARTVCKSETVQPTKTTEEKYMMMGVVAYNPHREKQPEPVKPQTFVTGDTTVITQPTQDVPVKPETTIVNEEPARILTNVLEEIPNKQPLNTTEDKVAKAPETEIPLEDIKINIYPNPNSGIFIIETKEKRLIHILDENGKLVLSKEVEGLTTIDASQLRAGIYSINAVNEDGRLVKKVVITK